MITFLMPSLGADMEAGFLRTWKLKTGQAVHRGDIIAEVETQKGILDIEIFEEGIAGELLLKIDDKVPVGTPMVMIYSDQEWAKQTAASQPAGAPATLPQTQPQLQSHPQPQPPSLAIPPTHRRRISPLARKLAEERGIPLMTITGSGPEGAIEARDIPEAPADQPKPVVSGIREAIAAAVTRSNLEIPHYHLTMVADMKEFLDHLRELNRQRAVQDRLLPIALLLRDASAALRSCPPLRSRWDGKPVAVEDVIIGLVTRVPSGGLVIPVVRDADLQSVDEAMKTISDLITRARNGHLRSSELQHATLSITSLTEGPAETVLGVIYPPQSALLGLGAIRNEPRAIDEMLTTRPVMTISLSADHRLTDGTIGNTFLRALAERIQSPRNHD